MARPGAPTVPAAPRAAVPSAQPSPAADDPPAAPNRPALRDVAFFAVLALFGGFALMTLTLGLTSAIAAVIPGLHEALHDHGVLDTVTGRIAEAVARASHHVQPGVQLALDYAFSLFNLALAAFLIWLRPRERTARLLALGMIGTAAIFNLQAYSVYEALDGRWYDNLMHDAFHLVTTVSYVLALILFPDGRLVPRWSRANLAAFYLAATAGVVALGYGLLGTSRTLAIVIVFGLLTPAVGVASQAYRYRRAPSAVERQQARLLFWTLSPALLLGAFVLSQGLVTPPMNTLEGRALMVIPVELFRVFQPVFAIIPIALFAGLLRFRLWDVDRIVSRTVTYVLLSAVLVATYGAGVVVLGRLLAPLGAGSDIAVAGATLAAAALLFPARRRIQDSVDRRFNRARYDAQREVEAFRLRLQTCVTLDEVPAELLAAIHATVQPSRAALWLRDPAAESAAAARR